MGQAIEATVTDSGAVKNTNVSRLKPEFTALNWGLYVSVEAFQDEISRLCLPLACFVVHCEMHRRPRDFHECGAWGSI